MLSGRAVEAARETRGEASLYDVRAAPRDEEGATRRSGRQGLEAAAAAGFAFDGGGGRAILELLLRTRALENKNDEDIIDGHGGSGA